jgi:hypothetical protein
MPVSRLLTSPERASGPRPEDRLRLALLEREIGGGAATGSELGLGSRVDLAVAELATGAAADPVAPLASGPTATQPRVPAADSPIESTPIETAVGPLGPVRAARWNRQLPANAGASAPTDASSPNAEATSS